MESMMTARQVAELLGVHENWVYDQAAAGVLPSYKIGGTRRFDRGEVRHWIAEHRQLGREQPAQRAPHRKEARQKATKRRDAEQPSSVAYTPAIRLIASGPSASLVVDQDPARRGGPDA
ncbi:MAG: helix-turn-helix domain-containing protein [Gaiellaceae bacterium]